MPQFIDIFAGCGGLSLGLMMSGWDGLFAIEREPNAFSTLAANLVNTDRRGPKFNWPEWLPRSEIALENLVSEFFERVVALRGTVDLLVGGPPCQGFSSAGKRNLDDPRNHLVDDYLRFVEILSPKIVLIENVKGFVSDFPTSEPDESVNFADRVQHVLQKDYNVHSQLMNVSRFGIPQSRERFILIALSKKARFSTTNPFDAIDETRTKFLRSKGFGAMPTSSWEAISDFETPFCSKQQSTESSRFHELVHIKPRTKYQKLMHCGVPSNVTDARLVNHSRRISERNRLLIRACKRAGRLNVSISKEMQQTLGIKKSALRVLDPARPAPTITSIPDDLLHYSEPRVLTVRENARLQSFPDWFAFRGKYTTGGKRRRNEVPRYTQVANAVPPLFAEALGMALLKIMC